MFCFIKVGYKVYIAWTCFPDEMTIEIFSAFKESVLNDCLVCVIFVTIAHSIYRGFDSCKIEDFHLYSKHK